MKKRVVQNIFAFVFLLFSIFSIGQKQYTQWCFGYKCGLDLNSTMPVTYTSNISAFGSCGSISDQAGNLLFYCNGDSIWNYNHQIMQNGTGLAGWNQAPMSTLILQKPGATNLYYVFTCDGAIGPNHYCYSIVDMSLASGTGSVITKNIPLWQPSLNAGKLVATKHCNGQDWWIITHEGSTALFKSYLLSATGLNTIAVSSVQGYTLGGSSFMKVSPNGKKIAFGNTPASNRYFAVHDFDNSTGVIGTNSVILTNVPQVPGGLEFSPDATKLYATNATGGQTLIWQWDLCSGNPGAIAASVQTITAPSGTIAGAFSTFGQFQLAPDGKIYIARYNQKNLGVINYPNLNAASCGFSNQGPYFSVGFNGYSLPNIPTSDFRNVGSVFTSTVACSTASFSAPQHVQSSNGCAAIGPTILSMKWNFGDPLSAGQNTSSALNPVHQYSGAGTFSAYLVVNYPCFTDTFRQSIVISNPAPSYSVTGKTSNCRNVTQTLSVIPAAYSYSWTGLGTSTSVVVSPTVTTVYSVVATNTASGCSSSKSFTVSVNPCLSVNDPENETSITIFPNPVHEGRCEIISAEPVKVLRIYNISGQEVLQIRDQDIKAIDLHGLKAGYYFIYMQTNHRTYRQKLQVE